MNVDLDPSSSNTHVLHMYIIGDCAATDRESLTSFNFPDLSTIVAFVGS